MDTFEKICVALTPFVTPENADLAILVSRFLVGLAVICCLGVLLLLRRQQTAGRLHPGGQGQNSGFTLIELLVVICIIGILAALTLSVAGFIQKKGARARAESEMAALSAALESYKADNGDYPRYSVAPGGSGSSGPGVVDLVAALMPHEGKVYLEFNKNMIQVTGGKTNVIDPFGESYGYTYPGDPARSGENFFDLWSRGGTSVTNQWIQNW